MSAPQEEIDKDAEKVRNYFEDDKQEVLFSARQYPYRTPISMNRSGNQWFCMIFPKSSFNDFATSWSHIRHGDEDYIALSHYIALQFVGQALQNKKHGTAPEGGRSRGFYYRPSNDGEMMLKFEIIVELLVKDLYRAEDYDLPDHQKRPLSRPEMMRDENIVGFRVFFVSNDPNYDFAYVLQKQLRNNWKTMSYAVDESDDSDSEDEEGGNTFIANRGGGGRNGAQRRRQNNAGGQIQEDDEDDLDDGADDPYRQRKRKKKKRTAIQKARNFIIDNKRDNGARTDFVTFRTRPRHMYLNVKTPRDLATMVFDGQFDKPKFSNNQTIRNRDLDLTSDSSALKLGDLDPQTMIRESKRLGCHPHQCDPANYFVTLNNYNANPIRAAGAAGNAGDANNMRLDDHDVIDSDDEQMQPPAQQSAAAATSSAPGGGGGADDDDARAQAQLQIERMMQGAQSSHTDAQATSSATGILGRFNESEDDSNGRANRSEDNSGGGGGGGGGGGAMAMMTAAGLNMQGPGIQLHGMQQQQHMGGANTFNESEDDEHANANIEQQMAVGVPAAPVIGGVDRMQFRMFYPELAWSVHPEDFSASRLFRTRFPWVAFSRETLDQKCMSAILWCARMNRLNASYCTQLQRTIRRNHNTLQYYYDMSNRRRGLRANNFADIVEGDSKNTNDDYTEDPTSSVSQIFMHIETSIFRIYGDDQRRYIDYLARMRKVALKQMYKTVHKNNLDLPDPMLAVLNHLHKHNVTKLADEINVFTLDVGVFLNAILVLLMQYEIDEVATNHMHLLQVLLAVFSAYLDTKRTGCDMKNNICFRGPPGTGKSEIVKKIVEYLIRYTVDDIVARSNMAIINPKARNYVVEAFDESAAIFDLPDSKLSSADKKTRRMETSGMSKQQLRYDSTRINKETGKRSVEMVVLEYNHVKILCTNAAAKRNGDAMHDRMKHVTIMKANRPGKSIMDFQTAIKTPEAKAQWLKTKTLHEKLQALTMFACIANKMCYLPNPTMSLMRVRMAQTFEFLKRHVPNANASRVRAWKMMEAEAMINVFHYAIHLVFFSELSPYRTVTPNKKMIERARRAGTFDPDDARFYTIDFEEFNFSHLAALGPYLVCTDDVAIRVITDVVYNLLDPMTYKIIYCLALEFGRFDVQEIFSYFDDESDAGYHKQCEQFWKLDEIVKKAVSNREQKGTASIIQSEAERINAELIGIDEQTADSAQKRRKQLDDAVRDVFNSAIAQGDSGDGDDRSVRVEDIDEEDDAVAEVVQDRQVTRFESEQSSDSEVALEKYHADSKKAQQRTERKLDAAEDMDIGMHSICKPINSDERKLAAKRDKALGTEPSVVREIWMQSSSKGHSSGKRRNRSLKRTMPSFIPAVMRPGSTDLFYNTSYLKLPYSVKDLKGTRGEDFCNSYGIDFSTFKATLDRLTKRMVRVRASPDIHSTLSDNFHYVRYSLANKLNPDAPNICTEGHEALMDDVDNCYLNVDILFEDPKRVIERLVKFFEYKHIRERKVLTGIHDDRVPFCLKSIDMKRNEDKSIRAYNVRYMPNQIIDAVNSNVVNPSTNIDDKLASKRQFYINEDLEVWAYRQHFQQNGYPAEHVSYFLPQFTEEMIRGVYGASANSDACLNHAAQKYLVQRGLYDFNHPQNQELMQNYTNLFRIIRASRRSKEQKDGSIKLASYPADYLPSKNKKSRKQFAAIEADASNSEGEQQRRALPSLNDAAIINQMPASDFRTARDFEESLAGARTSTEPIAKALPAPGTDAGQRPSDAFSQTLYKHIDKASQLFGFASAAPQPALVPVGGTAAGKQKSTTATTTTRKRRRTAMRK